MSRRHPNLMRLGIGVLLVSSLLLYWAFLHHLPFAGGPTGSVLRAEVRNAANVNSRTPVRIGGTDVGKVESVRPGPDGKTSVVVMRIEEKDIAVRLDATAQVRYRTLLGGSMYIDLDPGSRSAPALGQRTIALARTNSQVDWDEFNSLWAKPVPQGQRRIIKGFADALDDPTVVRALLREAGPAIALFGASARASRGQEAGELTSLVRRAARTAKAFAADGTSLDKTINGLQRTVSATAGARRELADTIDTAPAALRSARVTMSRLDRTLDRLDPLAEELRPGVRAMGPATRRMRPALLSLTRLLDRAESLLEVAPPALRALRGTARAGKPFLEALAPMVSKLNADLLPFLNERNPKTRLKVHEMIGPLLSAFNDGQSGFDGNGYVLRGVTRTAADSVVTPCRIGPTLEDLQDCQLVQQVFSKLTRPGKGR